MMRAISTLLRGFLFLLLSCSNVWSEDRFVGIAYSTLHRSSSWQHVWGTPAVGDYVSNDTKVIAKHAAWLADAGIDFIFVDWSNNLPYAPGCGCRPDIKFVEDATYTVFDTYLELPKHPKIAVMIGFPDHPTAPTDGSLQKKADQVYHDFLENKQRDSIYEYYEGKPLLIIYTGTPTPYQKGLPPWNDARFTVRWMTGFVTQQPSLLGPDRVSRFGYWSWEDRGPQSYTVENGHPEEMTITASWRADTGAHVPARSRMGGATFLQEWSRARMKKVRLALVVSWNEWDLSEQISAEASKDLEPSVEFGNYYLTLLQQQISQFKAR